MRKKFYKKKGFRNSNFKKDEVGLSNCFECNKSGHIKKNWSNLKGKPKKFKKEKKELYIRKDESEPSDSENEEKGEEANLSLTNPNIFFMANENEVNFDDYITLELIKMLILN